MAFIDRFKIKKLLKNIMISFLLPTRKRPGMAKSTIDSILNNVDNWNEIEILLATDVDDRSSSEEIKEHLLDKSFKNFILLDNFEKQGYEKVYVYINELSKIANNKWLWLWNDDIKLHSKNPNEVLKKYNDEFILINPLHGFPGTKFQIEMERNNQSKLILDEYLNEGKHIDFWDDHTKSCIPFPIIPKKWIELIGYYSLSTANDSWVEYVARMTNIVKTDPDLQIRNCSGYDEHGNVYNFTNDEVCKSRKEWLGENNEGPNKFWSHVDIMNKDVEKLKSYLNT